MTSTTFGLLTAISDVSHTSLGVHINQLDELNQMPPFSGICNLWLMSDGMILIKRWRYTDYTDGVSGYNTMYGHRKKLVIRP